ncbi:hypothetical protein NQ315_013557 [Exocentrus adspersus]|uniref:Tc1-like transposase DDE domain-containing protein n=1 Tax=Exocentrus adspersus TaxID=1586481 RepID=A0AAV8V8P8_9CUCU|nr:hypothetical protein NQ315_013557 [Exocentrus adspersus]
MKTMDSKDKKLKEDNPQMAYKETILKVTEQTGIGKNTNKIIAEYNRTGQVMEPNLKKLRLSFKEKIDELDKNAIRRKMHEFYRNKELLTLDNVMQAVALYYLDETWINAGDVPEKIWMDTTIKSHRDAFLRDLSTGPANPSGKGKCLIVLHIGSSAGFVPGGLLCFESKKNTADYHDEMNGNTFLDWFKRVLPTLNDNCVIVMDNAPYHSVKMEKIPNTSWRKNEIIDWLPSKGKEIDNTMVKAELLRIVAIEKEKYNKYIIDERPKNRTKLCSDIHHIIEN